MNVDGSGLTRAQLFRYGAGGGVAILAPGVLAACGGSKASAGGTIDFVYSDANSKDNLDPAQSLSEATVILNGMLYEGLVDADADFNPKPLLAKDWSSTPDAKEWTFRLRDGVKFHDGKPLTARDVVFSLRRHLDESVGSAIQANLASVLSPNGVRAVDATTVKLVLDRPNAFLLATLGLRQAQIIRDGTKKPDGNGTGPFKLKSFAPAQSFAVVKNENYWASGRPYIDGVRGRYIRDSSTKLQATLQGNAHITDSVDLASLPLVERNRDVRLDRLRGNIYYSFGFDSKSSPFNDPQVIRALQLATDRSGMVKTVFRDHATVAYDIPVPEGSPYLPDSVVSGRTHDPEAAAALLRKAGHTDLSFDLPTSQAGPGMVDLALIAKRDWEQAGIRVNVQQVPAETYWTDVWHVRPRYVGWWANRHPYDSMVLAYESKSTWNEGNYSNPRADALLRQVRGTTNEAEQERLMQELGAFVADTAPRVLPVFVDSLFVARKQLTGVKYDYIRHIDFRNARLA
ncbi:MAG TPA: ABC transporter substrate-binding protein [Thermoleophilaceae bacterium]|nr:ABC transporter substrate-binding protein [Thermoleophilaceae bacterium]